MKYFILLLSLFLMPCLSTAQSVTIDSIGLDTAGLTIVKLTNIDTTASGIIIRQEQVGLKKEFKRIKKNRIAAINREIDNLQQRIQELRARRAQLKAAFDLQ